MAERPLPGFIYNEASSLLQKAQEFRSSTEVGVEEATFKPTPDYPTLPIAISLMTDTHFGSMNVNYGKLDQHLKAIEETPNFYMVHNGDNIDNFNAHFFSSGAFENPIKPQLQTLAWMDRMKQLGEKGKIAAMSFGNHDQFMEGSGYDWLETFARDMQAPIFPSGGLLNIDHQDAKYKLAMTHMYWGRSKLNPTNANKRFMDFEYPDADISFLGHTHQSESLHFEKGGKDRVAVIGGTYKERDDWARQRGIGGRSGAPGHVVMLWPGERRIAAVKDFETAQQMMLAMIWQNETGGSLNERKQSGTLYTRPSSKAS